MKLAFASLALVIVAAPAFAGSPIAVPEIDTLSGLAAFGAVGGALTLLWERRRRK
jgi:hypothetical protein